MRNTLRWWTNKMSRSALGQPDSVEIVIRDSSDCIHEIQGAEDAVSRCRLCGMTIVTEPHRIIVETAPTDT